MSLILDQSPEDCVFCRIVAGRAAASVVARHERALAFMDLRQPNPGHVLVVPHAHVPTIDLLGDDDADAVMRLTTRVARALRRVFPEAGLSLWQSNGEAAGQEVPHVHMHLLPRHAGDGWVRIYPNDEPPAPMARARLDELAGRIQAALPPPR
jgi:histidine triad (HIT) family protein